MKLVPLLSTLGHILYEEDLPEKTCQKYVIINVVILDCTAAPFLCERFAICFIIIIIINI